MSSGVADGQEVSAAVTNAAFIAANGPSTAIGPITLDGASSTTITDVQSTLNVLISGVGGDQSTPATAYGAIPADTIAAGSDHLTALISLANKFFGAASAGGHTHDGTDGQGAAIESVVSSIAASGQSALTGAVVLAGGGLVTVNDVSPAGTIQVFGTTPNIQQVLDAGNTGATAGIDFGGGAIAGLSYEDWYEAGFPPGYPASGYLRMAASSDDHLYVKTSSSASHRVDTSIAVSGQSALYGDVLLVAGSNVTLSQSGQQITVAASAGGGAAATGSEVLVTDCSGWGSTNTYMPRFANNPTSLGSDITYADSATGGSSFTINTTGRYAVSYSHYKYTADGGGAIGISVNYSGASMISALTYAQGWRAMGFNTSSGETGIFCATTLNLNSGDVVRPQTNTQFNSAQDSPQLTWFRITRVD